MRRALLSVAALLSLSLAAHASVVVRVDNAAQRMTVTVDGVPTYSWPVSTARAGYRTPAGSYRVGRMERMWHSRKYDMSPMPHALFFKGGYAIHGTYSVRQLGRPASHGCVRLSPGNARTLFDLVKQHGGARVVVTGASSQFAAARADRPKRPQPAEADPFWGQAFEDEGWTGTRRTQRYRDPAPFWDE